MLADAGGRHILVTSSATLYRSPGPRNRYNVTVDEAIENAGTMTVHLAVRPQIFGSYKTQGPIVEGLAARPGARVACEGVPRSRWLRVRSRVG
jgi:hypothetical protein